MASPEWSPKFNMTGVVALGSLMLTHDEVDGVQDCYTLRVVERIVPEGFWLAEYSPAAAGDPASQGAAAAPSSSQASKLYPTHQVYFPIAFFSKRFPAVGEAIWALYDLNGGNGQPGAPPPLWSTVYYPAVVAKASKGRGAIAAPKGWKTLLYKGSDGSLSQGVVPFEAQVVEGDKPFPACIEPGVVMETHLQQSLAALAHQASAMPATAAAAASPLPAPPAAVASTAASPAAAASSVASVAGIAAASAPATSPVPPAAATAAPQAQLAPTPAPAAAMAVDVAAPLAVAAGPAVAGQKRKRDAMEIDVVGEGPAVGVGAANASPSSLAASAAATVGSSGTVVAAPPSPGSVQAAKRARKAAKKERKALAAAAGGGAAAAGAGGDDLQWDVPLPASQADLPSRCRWTLPALEEVVPALKPLPHADVVAEEKALAISEAASGSAVKREADAPAASDAATAVPSSSLPPPLPPPATASLSEHALFQALEEEFAQWNNLQTAKAEEQQQQVAASAGGAAVAAPRPSKPAQISSADPFLSYPSLLGVRFVDELKHVPTKGISVAPYVLDFLCQ